MNFQLCYDVFIILWCTRNAFSLQLFKDGGVVKRVNEKHRLMFVARGEKARLSWIFRTKENILFHGIVWTMYDRMFKNYTKLIWINEDEKLYQHSHTKDRVDYGVRFMSKKINHTDVQLTIVIPNVQQIHENKYVCHVVGLHIGSSDIELKVKEPLESQITSSNGNRIHEVLENTSVTFTCSIENHLHVAWFKNNSYLTPFRENNVSLTKTFSKDDEGDYICVVSNNSGKKIMQRINNIKVKELPRNNRSTSFHDPGVQSGQPVRATVLSPGEPKSSLLHHSDTKLRLSTIIIISISAGLVFAVVILVILIYKRRRTRLENRGNAWWSVENTDEQNLPVNCHENRRVSLESNTSRSDESTRTGFSYEDSIGTQSRTTCSFHGAMPVQFTIFRKHDDTKKNDLIVNDKVLKLFEIGPSLLQDMVPIGEGAFGVVAKATLLKESNSTERQTVAVKMLKAFASPEDKKDLISELNIMSRIERHRNVVRLIGCITISGPLCVITEYVSHGDLLGFLRKSRGLADTVYVVPYHFAQPNLSERLLLEMARDVAMGMAHLSRNQVIHRDLAARNVLVGENLECKITDFGMARDVKSTNYYRKRSRGRIPMKWTALEALVDERYSFKSDIWSFGILLYEIVTMGGTPYPGLGARELLRKLKSGWRMSKPAHVDTSLHEIMLKCWSSNPDDRPSFSGLVKTFKDFISARSDYINVSEYDESKYQTTEGNSSTHSYSDDDG